MGMKATRFMARGKANLLHRLNWQEGSSMSLRSEVEHPQTSDSPAVSYVYLSICSSDMPRDEIA
jgi:hypothetical protein